MRFATSSMRVPDCVLVMPIKKLLAERWDRLSSLSFFSQPHTFRTAAGKTPRSVSQGCELRQPDLRGALFELDPDRHPDFDRTGRAADDVAEHPRAFIQLDQRERVGRLGRIGGVGRPVHDGVRQHRAAPRRRNPPEPAAGAVPAKTLRRKLMMPARIAALDAQFARLASAPELRRLRRGDGNQLARLRHQSVSCVPRIAVPCVDARPPCPWTIASRAPATWRGPHSPRSWRTASVMWKIELASPAWQ